MRFVRDEGIVPVDEWIIAAAKLACGCYSRANVKTKNEGVTAAELLHRYGAAVGIPGHRSEHIERCKTWLIDHGLEDHKYEFYLDDDEVLGNGLRAKVLEYEDQSQPQPQPQLTDVEQELEDTRRMLAAVLAVAGPTKLYPGHLEVDWTIEREDDPITKTIMLAAFPPERRS